MDIFLAKSVKSLSCRYEDAGFNKTNTDRHKLAVRGDWHVVTEPPARNATADV